ncbi:MAG: outer membrane beta-barrel protein [Pseudomonadales bacterium]|nr:outer membrane beta-barrel protein [Pseudomonadales bacterium]
MNTRATKTTKTHALLIAAPAVFTLAMGSTTVNAYETGSWIVKGGIANVAINNDSGKLWTDVTQTLPSTEADAADNAQLGISIIYMYSDKIGIEVLGATPFEHDVSLSSGDLGAALDGLNLATIKHLPPTVSLQYYFNGSTQSSLQPFLGVGVNYTIFFEEKLTDTAASTLGGTHLTLDNSAGLALQAGIDYKLEGDWLINASVMYVDINTTATIDADGTDALSAGIQQITVDTDLDPFVYRVNVGYKF